jgi:hypothetical protein
MGYLLYSGCGYFREQDMQALKKMKFKLVKLLCISLALSCSLTFSVIGDAVAASSLSKKQQEARAHQRKKAGKISAPRKGNNSSSKRKGLKNGSKGNKGACESRLARSTSGDRCEYQPIKSISAFK